MTFLLSWFWSWGIYIYLLSEGSGWRSTESAWDVSLQTLSAFSVNMVSLLLFHSSSQFFLIYFCEFRMPIQVYCTVQWHGIFSMTHLYNREKIVLSCLKLCLRPIIRPRHFVTTSDSCPLIPDRVGGAASCPWNGAGGCHSAVSLFMKCNSFNLSQ